MAGFFEKIGDAFEKAGTAIADFSKDLGKQVWNELNEEQYQSPLEIQGIAMRQAMRPVRYYKKEYPYAYCDDNGFLRGNKGYVAASGWRPATYNLVKYVVDREYENIASKFNVQK